MVLKQIAGVVTTSGAVPVDPKDDWTVAKINKKDGATVKKDQTIITLRNFDGSTRNITAPSNGQVLSVNTLEGFSASGAVATIGTGRILVSVSVTESELNSFITNQPVAIAVNSSDQTTYGSVIFVSPVADSSVTQGASYRVLIEVAPGVFPDGVKSGMTATVEFPIADDDDVRYTNAKFIYEYEFSLNVDNEASLVSKNGSLVTSTPSLTSNLDSWRVAELPVQVGAFLTAGQTIAVLENFDGTKKTVPRFKYVVK
jgi:multidrug efflux pump subunit AcrA (membrane-fusion protein)